MSMTDEQIKQNALEYGGCSQEWFDDVSYIGESTAYDNAHSFYDGAHSRDEEIDYLTYRLNDATEKLQTAIAERDNLRNPWINVKNRLPEKLENDCVSDYVLTRIDGPRQVWYLVNRYNYTIKAWEGCNNNTTHWMPIPELKKGE